MTHINRKTLVAYIGFVLSVGLFAVFNVGNSAIAGTINLDVVERYTSPDIPEVSDLTAEEQETLVQYLQSL